MRPPPGQRPVPTADDDALYRRLIEAALRDGFLAQWPQWAGGALEQPPRWMMGWPDALDRYRRTVSTADLPETRPELERALKNLGHALALAWKAFSQYHPTAQGDWLLGEQLYKRAHRDHDVAGWDDRWNTWLDRCSLAVQEATKAANWLAEAIREGLDRQFLNQSWLFYNETAGMRTRIAQPRYTDEEKRARPALLANQLSQILYQEALLEADALGDKPPQPPRELVEPEPALEPAPPGPNANTLVPATQPAEAPTRRQTPNYNLLVVLIHGIRTQGEWQERLKSILEGHPGVTVQVIKYGFLNALWFWSPVGGRQRAVREVQQRLRDTFPDNRGKELVIVAHSFGTYITAKILEDSPDIEPVRILFCGSVVARNYRWAMLPPEV